MANHRRAIGLWNEDGPRDGLAGAERLPARGVDDRQFRAAGAGVMGERQPARAARQVQIVNKRSICSCASTRAAPSTSSAV
jgi:hypothetical protein